MPGVVTGAAAAATGWGLPGVPRGCCHVTSCLTGSAGEQERETRSMARDVGHRSHPCQPPPLVDSGDIRSSCSAPGATLCTGLGAEHVRHGSLLLRELSSGALSVSEPSKSPSAFSLQTRERRRDSRLRLLVFSFVSAPTAVLPV